MRNNLILTLGDDPEEFIRLLLPSGGSIDVSLAPGGGHSGTRLRFRAPKDVVIKRSKWLEEDALEADGIGAASGSEA